MNILVVNYRDRMHPAAGGAEKHLHRIFSQIAEAGHKVVLLTTAFAGCKALSKCAPLSSKKLVRVAHLR